MASSLFLPRLPATVYAAQPGTTPLANTNYAGALFPDLDPSLFAQDGDAICVEYALTADSSGGSKTYRLNIGYTSFTANGTGFTGGTLVLNNSTTTASVTYQGRVIIRRVSAGNYIAYAVTAVGTAIQQTAYQAFTLTDTAPIPIGMAVRDGGSNAGSLTLRDVAIVSIPVRG